jgi:UDP-N-acetylmuramoylalanine--D-glutamate ligase
MTGLPMELRGRKALVVGLGKSGVAAARLLLAKGADVAAADANAAVTPPSGVPLRALDAAAFADRDLVIVSPGVPLSLVRPLAAGRELFGEVELASRFIDEPLLGITGTNGKSTTTALLGHLLVTAGARTFTGGNLGTPLSQRVLDGGVLDASVCELSSYQLEGIATLRCAAATVLNLTPDHLDRYASLDEYAFAKARIFENQREGDLAALNLRDPRVAAMRLNPGVLRAGFDPRGANPAAAGSVTGKRTLQVSGRSFELKASTLRGSHNAENALAALLLAGTLVPDAEALQRGLDTYPGLPHRLEPVRVLGGVEYVNDSKATNVDSVEKSLSAFDRGVIIVMGGRGKGAPYAPLRALMQDRVKLILAIGEDAEKIRDELGDIAPVADCGALADAVDLAHEKAKPGDTVLLSPACASYDQFKNFEDRGEQFKRLVRELA